MEANICIEISNKTCKVRVEGLPSELIFLFARTFALNDGLTEIVSHAIAVVEQLTPEEKKDLGECTTMNLDND
jgi:hypothetical protein